MARWNRIDSAKAKILEELLSDITPLSPTKHRKNPPVWKLFHSRKATLTAITLFFCWFDTAFYVYLIFFSVGKLAGHPSYNTIYIYSLRTVLSVLLTFADRFVPKLGRKVVFTFGLLYVTCAWVIICGVTFADKLAEFARVIQVASVSVLGMGAIMWEVPKVLVMESFPTELRNSGFGLAVFFSRIGGILGPIVYELNGPYPGLPYVISAALLLSNIALLWLFVPETKGRPLPDMPQKDKLMAEEETPM